MIEPHPFNLNPKQSEALDLFTSNASDVMLYGGSRSGKTFFTVWAIFVRASKVKSRHVILRDKFNHAKRSLWLDTIPKMLSIAMPELRPHPNKSDYYYTLSNGSEVWIGGLDSKERTEKILGTEYSSIFFNETSQIDYSSINIAKTRLAEKSGLKKMCYYDSNPPTKSSWQYVLFEKKLDPIDNVPLENPEMYASMIMNPVDNIENIDSDYLKILSRMPEADKNRFLLGLYSDESDGQAYYEFRRDQHVKEFPEYPGTKFISSDFNVQPHCSFAFQIADGKIQVIEEFFLQNSDTPKAVSEWEKRYRGATVVPDSTGRNRKTSGQSDFDIIKAAGFKIISTHNPYVKDRVNLVNLRLKEMKIEIHPRCKKLINDLEKVSWKNNDLDQKTDPMLTHMSDCLGYACHNLMPATKLNLTPSVKTR
jgi:phage terminase large subunit